jgi:hypothetical protein
MSHGKFTTGYLPPAGDVTVTGPFNPDDDEVDFARIIFLVVQGRAQDTIVVRGEGEWHRAQPGSVRTEWRGTCPRHGDPALGPSGNELQEESGRLTRGIALSVLVQPGHLLRNDELLPPGEEPKEGDTFDPPAIEALNWCADLEIVGGDPPAPSTAA